MTGPLNPAPVAPAPEPAPAAPPPNPAPTPTWNPDSLPPEGKAWLDSQVAAATAAADKKARLGSKETAAKEAETAIAERLAQALGLKPATDAPPTVETLAARLAEVQSTIDAAAERAQAAEAEATVVRLASRLGADPEALLDSRRIVDALNAIDAESAEDFAKKAETVIAEALKANPGVRSATTGQGPARQGTDATGGGNTNPRPASLGAAISAAMKPR